MIADTEQQSQSSHDVVLDRVYGLLYVRHAVRCAGDFGELNDRFRLNFFDVGEESRSIQQVDFAEVNLNAKMFLRRGDPICHRLNRRHRLSASFRN